MRHSSSITPSSENERYVWAFDQREIDNPNPWAFTRLSYLQRLGSLLDRVRRWTPARGHVADIGCAQGTIAILLAEEGFRVDAYDLNPEFIAYAKRKVETGDVSWHVGDIFETSIAERYHTIILGEIVEHVAHPDQLIANASALLHPGGALILTTPNGEFIRERLPSYQEVIDSGGLPRVEREQFGPGGEHHLFAYTADELRGHIPVGSDLVELAYLGSGLFNSHVQWILNGRLGSAYVRTATWVSGLPFLRRKLNRCLLLVVRQPQNKG